MHKVAEKKAPRWGRSWEKTRERTADPVFGAGKIMRTGPASAAWKSKQIACRARGALERVTGCPVGDKARQAPPAQSRRPAPSF